ncbi:major capsid protein [Microviridae sp.]|nr:major capsid protein [Microviridae sp.]
MKSVMQHSFSQVPSAEIQRSSFDRSHGVKTTFDGGQLIPFFVDEVLPGDTFNCRTSGFARLATPIYPVMDNMYLETFYFAVPLRLIWDNFQKMMGEQDSPGDSTDYIIPTVTSPDPGGYLENSIFDYLGLPTKVPGLTHSALFLRAYNLIWNEWFRDQNLQIPATVLTDDGPDDLSHYFMRKRGKRHDYFTSSLPWPQKGDAVDIPIGQSAPVVSTGDNSPKFGSQDGTITDNYLTMQSGGGIGYQPDTILAVNPVVWNDPSLEVDLSNATAATINQLRQAFQIQKMYERDARGGTRYTEIIRAHFNVLSPDARLQRPEYLGGGSTPINITPIAQTAPDYQQQGEGSVGALGGMGTTSFSGHGFSKSFTEHCIVMGFCNVRADLTYQQGLNRMWSRQDRLDFYWPALALLGEQEVLNKEIYAQGDAVPEDDMVFGYQERYAEYRYKPSTIHGEFRSNAAQPLDAWHLSQDFENLPTLSDEFIKDSPPIDRVIAVPSEPHFIADFYHKLRCARPMPLFGVPGNIDRF